MFNFLVSQIQYVDREFTYHEQIPVILIVSWVNGIPMDLNLNLLETGSLVMTVFTTAFTLQVTIAIARTTQNIMKSGIVFYCLNTHLWFGEEDVACV
jgi:hypothetical protein